jgi:quinol monooxygenase YgiN
MITIIVKTKFENLADRDRMLAAISIAAVSTRQEPGVFLYQTGIDFEDPLTTHSLEIYTTEEALFAHNRAAHFATLIGSVSDLKAEITLQAYQADLEPYDLGPAIACGPMHDPEGEGDFSYQMQ